MCPVTTNTAQHSTAQHSAAQRSTGSGTHFQQAADPINFPFVLTASSSVASITLCSRSIKGQQTQTGLLQNLAVCDREAKEICISMVSKQCKQ